MQTTTSENAMTEIALALAMGFFSIMVLTLISFDTRSMTVERTQAVQVSAPAETGAGTVTPNGDDLIVIYHGGRFLSTELDLISADAIAAHEGRILLAVDPGAPFDTVLQARRDITAADLMITKLDASWIERLKKIEGGTQ